MIDLKLTVDMLLYYNSMLIHKTKKTTIKNEKKNYEICSKNNITRLYFLAKM